MIPYIEVLDKYTLNAKALIEPNECWFELSFYDVGEFEIYCVATQKNINALMKGNYVKIPNKNHIWVITAIKYIYTANGSKMISAIGKEAKWLLSKRAVLQPLDLSSLTISNAIYKLFNDNVIGTNIGARRIEQIGLQIINIDNVIENLQATRENLLDLVLKILKPYSLGLNSFLENGKITFSILQGVNKTSYVRFSQSLDNLLSSEYYSNDENIKNHALVVSKIEEVDYTLEYGNSLTGIDRSEIVINSNISTKYVDANGVEKETTPTSSLFKGWQREEAKNELSQNVTFEEANGELDLINSNYKYGIDFNIGDIVRVQDEYFNYSYSTRILKYTFKQDANGYGEEVEYGGL